MSEATSIRVAESDAEILACHPVLAQLRPQVGLDEVVARVRGQQAEGYRLAYLAEGAAIRSVAGFRIHGTLAYGRMLYIDDLVTDEALRSAGHGERLLGWLIELARESECDAVHLDSGVQRFAAHRFYMRHRFAISAHRFSLPLDET